MFCVFSLLNQHCILWYGHHIILQSAFQISALNIYHLLLIVYPLVQIFIIMKSSQ